MCHYFDDRCLRGVDNVEDVEIRANKIMDCSECSFEMTDSRGDDKVGYFENYWVCHCCGHTCWTVKKLKKGRTMVNITLEHHNNAPFSVKIKDVHYKLKYERALYNGHHLEVGHEKDGISIRAYLLRIKEWGHSLEMWFEVSQANAKKLRKVLTLVE